MNPCAVKWCCAMAKDNSEFCAVHVKHPEMHPVELAEDEEMAPGACKKCGGSGRCRKCDGSKFMDCHCHCGDAHDTDCNKCEDEFGRPTGKCGSCSGTGYTCVRKKTEAA